MAAAAFLLAVKSALTAERWYARDWRVSVLWLCRLGNLAGRWAGGRRAIWEAMPGAMPGGIRSAKSGGAGPVLGRWRTARGCGLRPGGRVGQATSRWGIYGGRGSGKRAGRFGGRQYRLSTPILHPSENITDLAGAGPWFGGIRRRTQGGDKSDGRQGGRRGGRLNREEGPAGRWAPAEGCGTGQDGGDMVTGGWRERSGVVDWLGRCPRRRNDGRGTREAGWFLHPTGGRGKTGGCLAGMGPAENPVAKTGNF